MEYPNLHKFPYLAIDTETTGLQYKVDQVFGFSISTPDGKDYYWDIREEPQSVRWFNDQMAKYKGKKIFHNASFDIKMCDHTGMYIPLTNIEDTCIIACQIDEHLFTYSLDNLVKIYLHEEKETDIYRKMADLFGGLATRNVQIGRISKAPPDVVAPYAKKDTRLTLSLWEWQQKEIERQGIQDIVEFEHDKLPTFVRSEMRGIHVDTDYAEQAQSKLDPIIKEMQDKLNGIAGKPINVDSSPQIKEMFDPVEVADGIWTTYDGVPIGTTPKGGPSINAEILREMDHPAAQLIIDLRSTLKTRNTFLGKHVLEHSVNGIVYPSINQSKGDDGGTGTGRLSYTNPAMQQIPSRNKKVAEVVKQAFLPPPDMVWVDADEASFEVRVFAHLVNNPEIVETYRNNPEIDFHQMVADMTGLVRNAEYSGQPNAKQLNLSMIFNSGNGAIADKMGMPWEWETFTPRDKDKPITYKKAGPEAMKVINAYHSRLKGIRDLAEGCKRTAEKRGYVFTSVGRRLRFPNGYKSYKASGLLIQATAADINKENWRIIEEELDGVGHLMLNTHDSYSMAMPIDWKPHYKRVESRLNRDRLRVPLILEFNGAGYNWHEALQKVDNT